MKLLRCVLLVGVFAFTPEVCRALSLHNAMAEVSNTMAETSELVKWLFFSKKQKFENYDCFTPSEFSFGTTGVVYRARFRPRRALPHMVWVTYAKDERIKWKRQAQVRRAMDGFSARLVVRHGRTTREIPPHPRPHNGPRIYLNYLPGGIQFYGHTLFVFYASGFGWRYDDEIELELEVLSPVPRDSCLRWVKPRLTVHELPCLR